MSKEIKLILAHNINYSEYSDLHTFKQDGAYFESEYSRGEGLYTIIVKAKNKDELIKELSQTYKVIRER